jgi:dihydrofolate reductase
MKVTQGDEVALICAFGERGEIGSDGALPWPSLRGDMAFLRMLTTENSMALVMGRKTYESLRGGLPGRVHLVVTSGKIETEKAGHFFFASLTEAVDFSRGLGKVPLVFGGSGIYEEALGKYDCHLFITRVFGDFKADAFFPLSKLNADLRNVSGEVEKVLLERGVKKSWERAGDRFQEGGLFYSFFEGEHSKI